MSADTRAIHLRDRVAFSRLVDLRERLGPDRMASGAVRVRGTVHALAMVMVARGAGIDEVIDTLHLDPGDLARACPTPTATPLPPGEVGTVFPDDDDDALPAPSGYRGRSLLALFEVPEAASLARLVPGQRGIVLFCASRGDTSNDVAAMLGITVDQVEAVLADGDGDHLDRSDR